MTVIPSRTCDLPSMTASTFLARLSDPCISEPDAATLHQAARCLLDYLGVVLGGAVTMKDEAAALLGLLAPRGGPCPVVGFPGHTADVATASLLMGMAAHVLELDDGHRYGMVHPGAPVFSALIPQAAVHDIPTRRVLVGAIAGYEACIRLARALQPHLRDAGYHATGVCGAIGAAIACATALGHDRHQLNATLSAACTSASGILKVIRDASSLKPYNAGHAAVGGLHAAAAGAAGYVGPRDVLADRDGFLHMMGAEPEAAATALGAAAAPAIHGIYVKPYASCRHCHAPVEAALHLRAANRLAPESIDRVRVTTHRMAAHLHDHAEIHGPTSAKMSIPYSVAAALVIGDGGLAAFSATTISRHDIQALAHRIDVVVSEEMTAAVPAIRPAEIAIHTTEGTSFTRRVDLPLGEPETPIDDLALTAKFHSLASFAGFTASFAESLATNLLGPSPDLGGVFD